MKEEIRKRAEMWLGDGFDEETRKEVGMMMASDPVLLEDAFYRNLEFGTGGLRGIMGAGTNRMNRYVVGMATQGFADYISECFADRDAISVAVSYDCRNRSREFASITASVFAANGFTVYLFDDMRPTPELSFAIRHYGCQAGVMVTASHNPKEYNGYKAYWEDGAQITAPHDVNVIECVKRISDPSQVRYEGGTGRIISIGKETDEAYLESILSLLMSPESVKRHAGMGIVYSPLHGTGMKLVPEAMRRAGFSNVASVPEQSVPDGNFSTVKSPNPEEKSALEMAVSLAVKKGAQLVLATDPDADRVGVAVKGHDGGFVLLDGNQTASLLTYYLLSRFKETGRLDERCYMVKTIVTTELMADIASSFGVRMYNVLTGFKYIAEVVRENEGKGLFVGGGEESYGFNAGEFVRDKDAVITCCLVAETAAWAADTGLDLLGLLEKIHSEYGHYREALVSVTRKGKEGLEEIASMMTSLRENPPAELAGSPVVKVIDYSMPEKTGLPKSNVLQFFSEDGSVVSVRPSGTEPKIKFYFGVKGRDAADSVARIDRLKAQFS